MLNPTDDDDFFTPITSSSLASLFGTTGNKDTSLIYTAPKQPKVEGDKDQSPKVQNKLIYVKTIQLFKLVNEATIYLGKYGLAIIGNSSIKSYDLIIYKTKQNIISTTKITKYLKFSPLEVQYLLRDDQNQSWCVQFENHQDQADFIQELAKIGAKVKNFIKMETTTDESCFSDGTGTQARADILNRISKVGQSMLPSAVPRGADISESETDEVVKTKKVVRKPKRHSSMDKETPQPINVDVPEVNQTQYRVPIPPNVMQPYTLNQYIPGQVMQCIPAQVMPLNDPLSMHFAENRTHNSEVRMNLSHLTNRLESVLSELSHMKTEKKDDKNDFLLKRIEQLEKKIEEKDVNQENETKVIEAIANEKENLEKLQEEINVKALMIKSLEEENESLKANNSNCKDLEEKNEELTLRLSLLEEFHERNKDSEANITLLREQINSLYSQIYILNGNYKTLQENLKYKNMGLNKEIAELKRAREENMKTFADLVKDKMNSMYQNIIAKFINSEAITGNQVKKELSYYMKRTTFKIIEACNETFKDDSQGSAPPVPEFEVTV